MLTEQAFAELQQLANARGQRKSKGEIPSLITGMGIGVCGYCGLALVSQNMMFRRRPDGTLLPGHRRLTCMGGSKHCQVGGSCSVVPVERSLMSYCADPMNLCTLMTTHTLTEVQFAAQAWQQLATGVEILDHEARLQARQLVKDTFARIVVHHRGMGAPEKTGEMIDVLLVPKTGHSQGIHIHHRSGQWQKMKGYGITLPRFSVSPHCPASAVTDILP